MVTLSYGHGILNDCGVAADFTGPQNSADPLTGISRTSDGDVVTITGTCDAVADEWVYYNYDFTDISATVYTKYLVRYKTSAASDALGARVSVKYDDAATENILGANPVFSTTWTIASGTLVNATSAPNIDMIAIWADDYPNTVAAGESSVYYDFVMLYSGDFTLPNVAGGMNLDLQPREAIIDIFGRDTDITQGGGTKNTIVPITCDLDQGNWKRTGDIIDGEVFLDIFHNRSSEPWQWLNTGSHQFKVTVHPKFRWVNNGDGSTSRLLDLVLKEYSLGSKAGETYAERYGIGL